MAFRSNNWKSPSAAACLNGLGNVSLSNRRLLLIKLDFILDDQTFILPRGSGDDGHQAQYRLTMMVPRRRFLSYLKERWWLLVLSLAITTGIVLTYETIRSETYNSYAQLMVGDVQLNQLNMASLFTEDPLNYFGTQIELLKSSRLQSAHSPEWD